MKKSYPLFQLMLALFLVGQNGFLSAKPPQYLYVTECYNIGMFAEFAFIAALLYEYDTHPEQYAGIEVDFHSTGLYYDSEHGPNWWNYFCEPICLGDRAKGVIREFTQKGFRTDFPRAYFVMDGLGREKTFDIIQKYIKIRQPILDQVDRFVLDNFTSDRIIAVHYRGTDKKNESPRVPYASLYEQVIGYISENSLTDYKIFVASDEQAFVEFMEEEFPGAVITHEMERSDGSHPLHLSKLKHQYSCGETAIIDCLILSRADVLIRTSSNLSQWSTFFNPTLPEILVKKNRRK